MLVHLHNECSKLYLGVKIQMPLFSSLVVVVSGNGTGIDCYYVIQAARIDGEPLIVEYEGETPSEYPGGDKQFSISGYDYDARESKIVKEDNQ